MSNTSASTGTLTHFKRMTWKSRLSESKPIIIFFLAAFFFGVVAGAIVPFLCHSAILNGTTNCVPLFFLGGMAASLSVVFGVRYVDRKLFGAIKSGVLAVEDRLISGDSKTKMEDLEKLVAGYLKLKRMEAADFYSKKLLEISKTGGTEAMKIPDWMVTSECWASTAEYQKSWNYKLVWLFETRGIITLSPHKLDFQSKKLSFSCDPSKDIVSLEIKNHPFWLKPIPCRYISITIDENGVRHVFNLTPSFGQTDTVFDCNKLVDVWFKRLQNINNSTIYGQVHGHPYGGGHPALLANPHPQNSGVPDWVKEAGA